MKSKNLLKNEDAVSISLGFILTFSISVLVFLAVILSFYTLLQNSEKAAMRSSYEILGSGLAARITTVDMLVNISNSYGGTVNSLEYEFSIPATIANEDYSVNINKPPGLVGSWTFDENSGTSASDSSGYGNTGTIYNATWTAGMRCSALNFNGVDSNVSVPSFSGTFQQVTVLAWVKINNYTDYRKILDFGLDGSNGRRFGLNVNNNGIDFEIDGGNNGHADYPTSDTANWTHVAGTWTKGQNVKIYINGQLKDTGTSGILGSDLVIYSGDAHMIGRRVSEYSPGVWHYFNGTIDDVKVYNRALTAAEINAEYSATEQVITGSDIGAMSWIPFSTSACLAGTTIYSGAQDYKFIYNGTGNTIRIGGQ